MRSAALISVVLMAWAGCGDKDSKKNNNGKKTTKPVENGKPKFQMTPELRQMKAEMLAVAAKVCACKSQRCATERQRPILRIISEYREVDHSPHIVAEVNKTLQPCLKRYKAITGPEEGLEEEANAHMKSACACKTRECILASAGNRNALRRRGMLSPAASKVLEKVKFKASLDKCTKLIVKAAPPSRVEAKTWNDEFTARMKKSGGKASGGAWPCQASWDYDGDGRADSVWRYRHDGPTSCKASPELSHLGCPTSAVRLAADGSKAIENVRVAYDDSGKVAALERKKGDKVVERALYWWDNDKLAAIEVDNNGDGTPEAIEAYVYSTNAMSAYMDFNADGNPDRITLYDLTEGNVVAVSQHQPANRRERMDFRYKWRDGKLISATTFGKRDAKVSYKYSCPQ